MKIDGYRPTQTQTMRPAQAQLSGAKSGALDSLRTGETLTATVSESGPKGLLLTLPDGTQVTASRNTPLDVRPGDKLEMTVTGRSGSQVLVEMNLPKNMDPAALLRAFGAEASPENMEIMREFLKNGVAPTRDNFNTIRSMLSEFNELSPGKAAFMIKNDIPINEQNITMFESFLNNEAQLGGKLMELHSLLESLNVHGESAPDAALLTAEPDATDTGNITGAQAAGKDVATEEARAGSTQAAPQDGDDIPATAQGGRTHAAAPQTEEQLRNMSAQSQEQIKTDTAEQTGRGLAAAQTDTAQAESTATDESLQSDAQKTQMRQGAAANTEQAARISENDAKTQDMVNRPELRDASAADTARTGIPQQKGDTVEIAKAAPQGTSVNAAETGEAVTKDASMSELRDMVKNLFRQIDDTNSRALARQMEAPRVVKEISTVLGLISEHIGEMNEAQRSHAGSVMRDIAQNLKFMEHMNNYTAFVQIPLMLNGNPTTANMYVWGDGKGQKKINPENSTIFLSLSTANIGRVESYVKIIGKNVECDFKLESMDTLNVIKGNITKLGNMLQGEGYRLSRVSFYESDKASNVLDIMETRSKETRRFNFDMKI